MDGATGDLPAPTGPTSAEPSGPLRDRFGRVHSDLRVSVTDHCNLRCQYCMPAEGLPWLTGAQMLTAAEITRIVAVGIRLGITSVRLTGGEPLLRRDLPDIVRRLSGLHPRPRLAMTTNGVGLAHLAQGLAEAGLDRINVSLDSTDWETYVQLTRRDRLDEVMVGLTAAVAAGLRPVKVNAVLIRGVNEEDAADLLRFCLVQGHELRFIEQMPLDAQREWSREQMVTGAQIRALLERRFSLTPLPATERGSSPAQRFLVDGGPGVVGIIASVSEPFCDACDRLRLTADGMLRNCLFARGEVDLRTPLRDGADDSVLEALIRAETLRKARGHGIGEPDFTQPVRPMSAIGG